MDWSSLIWILVFVLGCYFMMRGMGGETRRSEEFEEPQRRPNGHEDLEHSPPDRRER